MPHERNRPIDLSIIIVNWNAEGLLRNCLASIGKVVRGCRYELIVSDNASADGSCAMVEEEFPQARLIRNTENLGFAKANNQAMKEASADVVCLVNSDTLLEGDCLSEMLDFMKARPSAVACAPALRLPDGNLQTGACGFDVGLATAFNYFFFLTKLFPNRFRGIYLDQKPFVKAGKPVEVDWLSGACLMVRKAAVDATGGLDESFFMYAEDLEWCSRLRQVGEIYYLPNLEIIHYHGASSKVEAAISTKWLDAMNKHVRTKYSRRESSLFSLIAASGFMMRMVANYAAGITDSKRKEKADALREFCRFSLKQMFR